MFGLESIVTHCQRIEDAIAEEVPSAVEQRIGALVTRWRELSTTLAPLVGERHARIEIQRSELDRLVSAVRAGMVRTEILRVLTGYRLEPTERRLERYGRQASALAGRLGKPEPHVVVESNDVRLDPSGWAPFWATFIHALRNAVDHGLELPDERAATGKPERGTLCLRSVHQDGGVVIEVSDDGRGIDWAALAARGRTLGLPFETTDDLDALLFREGVSTRADVTDISGRGVGMGALRAACRAWGGELHVRSILGEGTTLSFRFPSTTASPLTALSA